MDKTKRFSRSYLDSDNAPIIEADLDITGGVKSKVIKDFILRFEIILEMFVDHLQEAG